MSEEDALPADPGDEDAEESDLVELACPDCDDVQEHEILRAAESGWTVECQVCHRVRTLPAPKQERLTVVPAILSDGAKSRTVELAVPLDGYVTIDDEFDLEGARVRITAVEKRDGTRPKKAPGRTLKVLYAVKYDTVLLRYTLNQGEITRSFKEEVIPEDEIHIGSVREVQGVHLVVKTLKSDQNRTLHRGFLYARNIRRVFADLAPTKARAGQRVYTRQRGAGPWGSKKPTSRVKGPPRSGAGTRRD